MSARKKGQKTEKGYTLLESVDYNKNAQGECWLCVDLRSNKIYGKTIEAKSYYVFFDKDGKEKKTIEVNKQRNTYLVFVFLFYVALCISISGFKLPSPPLTMEVKMEIIELNDTIIKLRGEIINYDTSMKIGNRGFVFFNINNKKEKVISARPLGNNLFESEFSSFAPNTEYLIYSFVILYPDTLCKSLYAYVKTNDRPEPKPPVLPPPDPRSEPKDSIKPPVVHPKLKPHLDTVNMICTIELTNIDDNLVPFKVFVYNGEKRDSISKDGKKKYKIILEYEKNYEIYYQFTENMEPQKKPIINIKKIRKPKPPVEIKPGQSCRNGIVYKIDAKYIYIFSENAIKTKNWDDAITSCPRGYKMPTCDDYRIIEEIIKKEKIPIDNNHEYWTSICEADKCEAYKFNGTQECSLYRKRKNFFVLPVKEIPRNQGCQ